MGNRALCVAIVLLAGCHRDLDVQPCAHEPAGCVDAAGTADTDNSSSDAAVDAPDAPTDSCQCKPGDVSPTAGTCPGALEKRVKKCTEACVWSDDTCELPKGWTKIADSPSELAGRLSTPAVWTGGELMVFGGASIEDIFAGKNDGAVFSLVKNAWSPLPASPAAPRHSHSAVWTGREMIIFGGADGLSKTFADGYAYDVLLKTWEKLPDAPLASRSSHSALYIPGLKRMLIWGGVGTTGVLADGAAYDTDARAWSALPPAPISARSGASMVWTGTEVLVFGGDTATGPADNGALLNLSTGAWRSVPFPAVDPRRSPKAAFTSSGFVFFGGEDPTPFDGARLALGTLTWSKVPAPAAMVMAPRGTMQSWSDGERLFLWSGLTSADPPAFASGGAILDPKSSTWDSIATVDAPTARAGALSVWTGKAGLIWGGFGAPGGGATEPLAAGAIYVP